MLRVRSARPSDAAVWLRLRLGLWPGGSDADHRVDIDRFFGGEAQEPLAVLLAEDEAGRALGVAELSLRAGAAGCRSDRVAYLEGWFVVPEARRRGVGGALITAAERWARAQGCSEFASDTDLGNEAGVLAHRAVGFTEVSVVGVVRCFRKAL